MTAGLDRLLLIREIEEFLYHEASLLDRRRFEDWMALFAEDGVYWAPARPDQESAIEEASIFYEDRRMLEARVRRLAHPRVWSQIPPSRSRHLLGNVVLERIDEESKLLHVRSSLVMFEYRDDERRAFAADCRHRLRRAGDGSFRIALKRVELVDCDAAHGYLSVPF